MESNPTVRIPFASQRAERKKNFEDQAPTLSELRMRIKLLISNLHFSFLPAKNIRKRIIHVKEKMENDDLIPFTMLREAIHERSIFFLSHVPDVAFKFLIFS